MGIIIHHRLADLLAERGLSPTDLLRQLYDHYELRVTTARLMRLLREPQPHMVDLRLVGAIAATLGVGLDALFVIDLAPATKADVAAFATPLVAATAPVEQPDDASATELLRPTASAAGRPSEQMHLDERDDPGGTIAVVRDEEEVSDVTLAPATDSLSAEAHTLSPGREPFEPSLTEALRDTAGDELDSPAVDGTSLLEMYQLPVASLRFVAEVDGAVSLPPYAGSTLRGAFGHALKRTACLYRHQGMVCEHCLDNRISMQDNRPTHCVYGYLFDTPRPPQSPLLEQQQEVPHPYVIRPVTGQGAMTAHGQLLIFEIQLCGLALHCASAVVEAVVDLCRHGLGAGRGRSEVRELWECAPFEDRRRLAPFRQTPATLQLVSAWPEALAAAATLPTDRLAVHFLTPARLVRDGSPVAVPAFSTLVRTLLRRLTLLGLFHNDAAIPQSHFRWLAEQAEEVALGEWTGSWQDWERYSSRQGRRMTFGGVVGRAVYEGDISPFLPYLVYGQALHVGKSTTFGGGWYHLSHPDDTLQAPLFATRS